MADMYPRWLQKHELRVKKANGGQRTLNFGKTSSKGKRLIVLNAITMDNFVVTRDPETGYPISEESIGKNTGPMLPLSTAEWIWLAGINCADYHKNMDGDAFERWLHNRLIPAFEALYPGKK